jgi:hypothetical protein
LARSKWTVAVVADVTLTEGRPRHLAGVALGSAVSPPIAVCAAGGTSTVIAAAQMPWMRSPPDWSSPRPCWPAFDDLPIGEDLRASTAAWLQQRVDA